MEDELMYSQPTRTTFVYDTRTGDVVHVHQFVPAKRDGTCSEDEMKETALRLAPANLDRAQLGVLHSDEELELTPEYLYRVDTASRRLIKEPVRSERISG